MKIKYDVYYTSPIEDEVFIDVDVNKIVDFYFDLIKKHEEYKTHIEDFIDDYLKEDDLYGYEFYQGLTHPYYYDGDEHSKCFMDDKDFENLTEAIKNEIARRNNEN